ncbi:MAG: DUF131 domain-containing protein [Candidatus Aenigmarchaeota archaeon]|nr:DUF131 domain-containing protein [Candidatus Aenigmarchaeota archaeon]
MAEINIVSIGIAMILLGFLLVFVGTLTGKSDGKVAVGGVIGFIPFGFGNDPQLVKIAIVISAVLAILFIVMALRGFL